MVGSIHPFSLSTRDLPHLPLYDLVRIAWNHIRGEREHNDVCVICQYSGEWCLDLIWSKWKHGYYIHYNEFIYNLLFTHAFDKYMCRTPSCDLPQMEGFFMVYYLFNFFDYLIVNLVLF